MKNKAKKEKKVYGQIRREYVRNVVVVGVAAVAFNDAPAVVIIVAADAAT